MLGVTVLAFSSERTSSVFAKAGPASRRAALSIHPSINQSISQPAVLCPTCPLRARFDTKRARSPSEIPTLPPPLCHFCHSANLPLCHSATLLCFSTFPDSFLHFPTFNFLLSHFRRLEELIYQPSRMHAQPVSSLCCISTTLCHQRASAIIQLM